MSEIPAITLSVEAKELIINLVKLDTKVKEDKLQLFSQLLELWKLDLSTGSSVTINFQLAEILSNRSFLIRILKVIETPTKYYVFLKGGNHTQQMKAKLFLVIKQKLTELKEEKKL